MRQSTFYILYIAISLIMLVGCSSVQTLETWRSSSLLPGTEFKKLLIVNINLDENVRKMFEDIVTAEMEESHIMAVAGHKHVAISGAYKRDDIAVAVNETGCDAVLTIRELTEGNQQISQQGQGSVLYGEGFLPSSWNLMIATLQANLYSTETEQLIWSSTIKTSDDDNKYIVSRDTGQLLIKLLRRDKMISP